MTSRRRGFTLVEVLVAIVIVAGISAAATVAISQSLRAQAVSGARREARARAEAAAERISIDVENLIRDGDLYDVRVLLMDAGSGATARDQLLLFSGSATVARAGNIQAEGGRYEIQYRPVDRLVVAADHRRTPNAPASTLVLWRRVDPIPDDVPDGGGVVFPVAEGLLNLSIEAFDGESWYDAWDSDRDGIPHALRIEATATSNADSRRTATARRVVAIDRIPVPFVTLDSSAGSGG